MTILLQRQPLLFASLILFLPALRLEATTYTVKSGGGGSFTTISACAATAVAGDTCTVFAGSYAGWTQSASGSVGNPITFQVNGTTLTTCALTSCSGPNGDTVNVTSAVNVSGTHYIQIIGFRLQNTVGFNTSTNHITIAYSYFSGTTFVKQVDGVASTDADNVFSYNMVDRTGSTSTAPGFYFYGDRNRFEHNEIKGGEGDCHELGGINLVVRDNYCHDYNGASGEHLDFIQEIGGGTTPPISFSLVEGNVIQNCTADGGNCHAFAIIRTGTGPVADTIILRYNYAQNIDGDGINFGGSGDNVPNNSAYNNTLASGHLATYNESFDSVQGTTPNTTVLNNIAYNVQAGGYYPFGGNFENGNLAFTTGYSGSWGSLYSSEATYALLHNKDPLFANYPTDGTLQATSPAIGAGVALTTVAPSDPGSGTSLVLVNSHLFQPGWSGTQGDWIRVGSANTSQITAINYSTNTLTISPAISRSPGDAVYLYKNSNGIQVLFGSNPDIGAFPYSSGSQPAAPTNLTSVAR